MTGAIYSRTFVGDSLSTWQVAHEMSVRIEDGSFVVSDSDRPSYHLLRLHGPEFVFRIVTIRCLVKFRPTASTNFYIHHFGNLNVAEIDARGTVVDQGISRKISVHTRESGLLDIEVTFLNCHPTISIGCSDSGHPVYAGTGHDQFALASITVETFDATAELSQISPEDRITLVDVGGQGGLQTKWMLKADQITPIVFEPIASEAAAVRETLCRIPGAKVVEKALADISSKRKLHVAAASDCSSLREPNLEILQHYSIGPLFNTIMTEEVECVRYDELFRIDSVPKPDFIKIDVQGLEYEVLIGMGSLLEGCLAIELETHFVPIYRGQRLIGDIVGLLWDWGFVLRNIGQVPHFDGDAVEFDALFLKRRDKLVALSEKAKRKLSAICGVLEVNPYK
ncbi:FkbM family methyltransferase [Mesorhizobium sp. B1-1-8]|uniref:FkbM family methyltransferase n=1 Tax=Mesorhizobium sp. B1-1-8 TaxID=2589976 RepID=UPI00112D0CF0|nr:FkbM family methyltransferase [Mesorhizobium sp. B1-1-8]UCI09540.1 FkbM family methyltransferase [Mesorhizobium sp. B1-1-8]